MDRLNTILNILTIFKKDGCVCMDGDIIASFNNLKSIIINKCPELTDEFLTNAYKLL